MNGSNLKTLSKAKESYQHILRVWDKRTLGETNKLPWYYSFELKTPPVTTKVNQQPSSSSTGESRLQWDMENEECVEILAAELNRCLHDNSQRSLVVFNNEEGRLTNSECLRIMPSSVDVIYISEKPLSIMNHDAVIDLTKDESKLTDEQGKELLKKSLDHDELFDDKIATQLVELSYSLPDYPYMLASLGNYFKANHIPLQNFNLSVVSDLTDSNPIQRLREGVLSQIQELEGRERDLFFICCCLPSQIDRKFLNRMFSDSIIDRLRKKLNKLINIKNDRIAINNLLNELICKESSFKKILIKPFKH